MHGNVGKAICGLDDRYMKSSCQQMLQDRFNRQAQERNGFVIV
jgi:hypothetical protein